MGVIIDLFLPKNKRNRQMLFDAAIDSSNQITNLFKLYKEGDFITALDQTAFTLIYPNDECSPAIYWMSQTQYIIKYPPHSKPYNHKFEDKCKFIECLSGKLYDKNSNFKLFPGDRIKVTPKDTYSPYTLEETCYIRVCIGDCNSVFENICGK